LFINFLFAGRGASEGRGSLCVGGRE